MAKEYKNSLKQLSDKLKAEPPKTPLQEVRPVEANPPLSEVKTVPAPKGSHVNFWIDEQLMQRLKIYAVTHKKTIKQIGAEAFEAFLKANE